MSESQLYGDGNWPRANTLLDTKSKSTELALIGVPAHLSSLSPTSAHLTPGAIRAALARFSTFSTSANIDLPEKFISDLGDIDSPDFEEGYQRVKAAVDCLLTKHKLLIALGGDNSITYTVASNLWPELSQIGIITFDAHHDLRDGYSNGSPIWQLIQAGVRGENIVQIGIADFANSAQYSERAHANGLHIISRSQLRTRTISEVVGQALEIAGFNGREIYVDLDVDVCDRGVAPGCPAALPGGISAGELRQAAFLLARDKRVRAIDITEIDAASDAPDERTVRLAALLVLEIAAGFASRKASEQPL